MPQELLAPALATATHAEIELARTEQPEVYQEGDCWRFRWFGEDRGSFDTEQDAHRAAGRHKQHRLLQRFAAALERD